MNLRCCRSIMDPTAFCLLVLAVLFNVAPSTAQSPVYVDAASPSLPSPPKEAPRLDLITQTVYGFLDFTTTIGNTVMVFSPQSSPSPDAPKLETTPAPIVETPPVQVEKVIKIKPSKPAPKPAEKGEIETSENQKASLKVHVVSDSSKPSPKKELKSVVSVVSSVVNEAPKILSSKIEIVASSSAIPSKKIGSKIEMLPKIIENGQNKGLSAIIEVKQGSKAISSPKKEIVSKVEVKSGSSVVAKSVPQILSSKVEIIEEISPSSVRTQPIFASVVEVLSSDDEDDDPPILVANNNIGDPEYDFLSRQPSEFVEETYKVINLRPSKSHNKPKHAKPRSNTPSSQKIVDDDDHPLGLVTKLGGTVVKEGLTTVHETSVIGTVISGKYAQVLHSTSHVFKGHAPKPKISPSSTLRILKTAAPALAKNNRFALEPTPAASLSEETSLPLENLFGNSPNLIRPSRRPAIPGGSFKNRHKAQEVTPVDTDDEVQNKPSPSRPHSNKKHKNIGHGQQKTFSNRYGRSSSSAAQLATVSVFSEPSTASYSNRRQKSSRSFKSAITTAPQSEFASRRGYKPRVQASAVENNSSPSTSLYKFKLNRAPGRWQYKTTAKPRVEIKKIIGHDDPTTPASASTADDSNYVNPQSRSDNIDLELSGSHNGPGSLLDEDANENSIDKPPPVETIKVEISTAADFKDIYFEIATIKSPYTFQVGTVKNTRYITVTSTFQKSFEPTEVPAVRSTEPLTENILATASNFDKDNLDSSIATLPPLYLAGDMETPPLETLTETFSTTQTMLKTHILPVIYNGINTTSFTLVQTYAVTRLVTATKTLPPMEAYQFVPSKTLNEFNSRLDEAGSELHLELEFGDDNEQDEEGQLRRSFPPDLELANIGSEFDLSEVDKSRFPDNHPRHKKAHSSNPKVQQVTEAPPPTTPALTPEQAQQLALLRLLNPAAAAQIPNVITTSKPVVKIETLFESHVIPFFNGQSTVHSTISRPVATVTKTEYEVGLSTLPALPVQQINPLFQQQQNPLFQQQQNPFQITSTPIVTHTEVTATESKILKLTFGAKTAYTTIYSTRVVPTLLTTYLTANVPVQQTQAFPGYFPSPYGPYGPYVG